MKSVKVIAVLCINLALMAFGSLANGQPVLDDVLLKASRHIRDVHSLKLRWYLDGQRTPSADVMSTDARRVTHANTPRTSTFLASDSRFLITTDNGDEYAYSGSQFQLLSTDYSILSVSVEPQLQGLPADVPLLLPFKWVASVVGGGFGFSDLRDVKAWAKVAEKATLDERGDTRSVLGDCVVARFQSARPDWLFDVYFCKELECYPVKWVGIWTGNASYGEPVMTVTVNGATTISTENRPIVVPTKVTKVQTSADGKSLPYNKSFRVDHKSVRINEIIPDDAFHISASRARTFVDKDRVMESERSRSHKLDEKLNRPAISLMRQVVLATTIVIIVILLLLKWTLRK